MFQRINIRKGTKLWKREHKNAYKQFLVHPQDINVCVIAAVDPTGSVKLFISKVLPFGLVGSVYGYNRISQALTFLMNRMFMTPMLGYFDDYCGCENEETVESSFRIFGILNEVIGIEIKIEKDEVPTFSIPLLGFEVTVIEQGTKVTISEQRIEKYRKMIQKVKREELPLANTRRSWATSTSA